MAEITANINWLAVVVGTVISFLVGWLWYSPKLFGQQWAEGNNVELATSDKPMPIFPLLFQLIATFFLAWLIAVTAATDALMTAFLALLTIALLIASNGAFAQKSKAAIWIETGFIMVMGIIMITCHAVL